jgi:Tol biopolymer transport system component
MSNTSIFAQSDSILFAGEPHFKNVIQLTKSGDNAEAYWSFDSKRITFQRANPKEGINCDQIFMGLVPKNNRTPFTYKSISGGIGRTTCSYFTKDGKHIIYASTKGGGNDCPPGVDRAKYGNKYIWPLYPSFDIFIADLNGNITKQLTNTPGYDAEATISPDGKFQLSDAPVKIKNIRGEDHYPELTKSNVYIFDNLIIYLHDLVLFI